MRRLLLVPIALVVSLMLAAPSVAQDACAIHLGDVVAQIVEAQGVGQTDLAAGVAALTAAREQLAALIAACNSAGFTAAPVLDGRYSAPNGSFTVTVPGDWRTAPFLEAGGGGIAYFGNNQHAAEALTQSVPILDAGDQSVAVAVLPPDQFGVAAEASVADAVTAFAAQTVNAQFEQVGDLSVETVDEREIARISFSGGDEAAPFDAELTGVALPGGGAFVLIVAVAPVGEMEALHPLAQAIALSVR